MQSRGQKNRVLMGSKPFAMRIITMFDVIVENCQTKKSARSATMSSVRKATDAAATHGSVEAEESGEETHPVADEDLRALADEHVDRLRDVLLLPVDNEVARGRDQVPSAILPERVLRSEEQKSEVESTEAISYAVF